MASSALVAWASLNSCSFDQKKKILYAIGVVLTSLGWAVTYIQSRYVEDSLKVTFYVVTIAVLIFTFLAILLLSRSKTFIQFWNFASVKSIIMYFLVIWAFEGGLMVWAGFFADHVIEKKVKASSLVTSGLAGVSSILLGKIFGCSIFALTPTMASITISLGVTEKNGLMAAGILVGQLINLCQKGIECYDSIMELKSKTRKEDTENIGIELEGSKEESDTQSKDKDIHEAHNSRIRYLEKKLEEEGQNFEEQVKLWNSDRVGFIDEIKSCEKGFQDQKKLHEQELQGQKKLHEQELQGQKKLHEQELQEQKKLHEQELQGQKKLHEQELQAQRIAAMQLQEQKELQFTYQINDLKDTLEKQATDRLGFIRQIDELKRQLENKNHEGPDQL